MEFFVFGVDDVCIVSGIEFFRGKLWFLEGFCFVGRGYFSFIERFCVCCFLNICFIGFGFFISIGFIVCFIGIGEFFLNEYWIGICFLILIDFWGEVIECFCLNEWWIGIGRFIFIFCLEGVVCLMWINFFCGIDCLIFIWCFLGVEWLIGVFVELVCLGDI